MQLPARLMPALAASLEALCPPLGATIDHNPSASATSSASTSTSASVSASGAVSGSASAGPAPAAALELATAVVALAEVALSSQRWLDTAGGPAFAQVRDGVRATLKRPLTRMLVLLVGVADTARTKGEPH